MECFETCVIEKHSLCFFKKRLLLETNYLKKFFFFFFSTQDNSTSLTPGQKLFSLEKKMLFISSNGNMCSQVSTKLKVKSCDTADCIP